MAESIFAGLSKRDITLPIIVLEAMGEDPEFVVEAMFLDGVAQDAMQNACQVRGRTGALELNRDKYADRWCAKVLKGWTGLTLGNMTRMFPNYNSMSPQQWIEKYPSGEIPFSHAAAVEMYKEARFQDFVNIFNEAFRDTTQVLETERKLKEENLPSTPSSNLE